MRRGSRHEVASALRQRYHAGSKTERAQVFDEFCGLRRPPRKPPQCPSLYGGITTPASFGSNLRREEFQVPTILRTPRD